MGVVVNEACGDDDDDDDDGVCRSGRCPRCVPTVLEKTVALKGSALDQSTETLKKEIVVVRVQGGIKAEQIGGVEQGGPSVIWAQYKRTERNLDVGTGNYMELRSSTAQQSGRDPSDHRSRSVTYNPVPESWGDGARDANTVTLNVPSP